MILSRKDKVHSQQIVSLYFHLKNEQSCEIEQIFTSRLLLYSLDLFVTSLYLFVSLVLTPRVSRDGRGPPSLSLMTAISFLRVVSGGSGPGHLKASSLVGVCVRTGGTPEPEPREGRSRSQRASGPGWRSPGSSSEPDLRRHAPKISLIVKHFCQRALCYVNEYMWIL